MQRITPSFADLQTADRRLVILRVLAEAPGYAANQYVLGSALRAYGHDVSQDRLQADLYWLAEQTLVAIDDSAGVLTAKISQRGADVAAGRAIVPGVKRPEPGV